MSNMKKILFSMCLLVASLCSAQTHTVANRDTNNTFTKNNQFAHGITVGPVTFAQLTNLTIVSQADGTLVWVTDAVAQNPCIGGGTGAFAFRENGVWQCSIAGSGGGSGTVNAGTNNHLSKYVAGSTVGDSSIIDNGTAVSTTETFSASQLISTVA